MAEIPINFRKNAEKNVEKYKGKKEQSVSTEIPLFSQRNIFWEGIGNLRKGYNVVSVEAADAWLTKSGVRVATNEELVKEYNL